MYHKILSFHILISAVIVSYVSRKFTDPILELNAIAKQESDAADSDSKTQTAYKDFQSSVAQVKISGIIRVDRFIAEDGTVYVLMFVPSDEIKRAMPSDSEFSQKVMDIYVNGLNEDKD